MPTDRAEERLWLSSAKGMRIFKDGVLQPSLDEMFGGNGKDASTRQKSVGVKASKASKRALPVKSGGRRCFVINAKDQQNSGFGKIEHGQGCRYHHH